MNNALDFLERANHYTIEKQDDGSYMVSTKDYSNLVAFISSDWTIDYCISDVYNSGSNFAMIDVDELNYLIEFCNFLQEFELKNFEVE